MKVKSKPLEVPENYFRSFSGFLLELLTLVVKLSSTTAFHTLKSILCHHALLPIITFPGVLCCLRIFNDNTPVLIAPLKMEEDLSEKLLKNKKLFISKK